MSRPGWPHTEGTLRVTPTHFTFGPDGWRYSRAAESLTALAKRFDISLSGLTIARDRVEQALREDRKLLHTWSQIEHSRETLQRM